MPKTSPDTGGIVKLWFETGKLIRRKIFLTDKNDTVNPQQLFAVLIVKEHDGLTMKELAQHLGITSSSATSLVNRLVRMKWLVRKADPKNRKLVRLKVAPAGGIMLAAKIREKSKSMQRLLMLLEQEDINDFYRILKNLHSALSNEHHGPR